jgi:DNA-binding transcriptional MerR regulator
VSLLQPSFGHYSPERVGCKRRHDEAVLRRLTIIDAAKRAGFTIEKVRTLIHGFPTETAAAKRLLRSRGCQSGVRSS